MDQLASVEANVLRTGFDIGFFSKADIARWADRQIDALDEPPLELIDLSMNQDVDPHDILKHLDRLGQTNPSRRIETEIGFVGILISLERITLDLKQATP